MNGNNNFSCWFSHVLNACRAELCRVVKDVRPAMHLRALVLQGVALGRIRGNWICKLRSGMAPAHALTVEEVGSHWATEILWIAKAIVSGNKPPPATGLPGTGVAEGLRKMQVVIYWKTMWWHRRPKFACGLFSATHEGAVSFGNLSDLFQASKIEILKQNLSQIQIRGNKNPRTRDIPFFCLCADVCMW